MFILKKIFQLRDKAHGEEAEKPFLEHLEDLRGVITKIILVLLISTIGCFVFKSELMAIIRKPIEQVWETSQETKMPSGQFAVTLETWEQAKKAAQETANFTPAQQKFYFEQFDPEGTNKLWFHTKAVPYYRVAIALEKETEDAGIAFIKKIPDISEEMRNQLTALMDEENRPNSSTDAQGKVVRMQALNPTEGFMLSIKLAFFAGVIISFPFLLYFILQFVLPGLKENEKRALWPALAIGFGLFLVGVFFAYFLVLPKVLDFFYVYSQEMGVENEWRIGYYISFATQFTLIFGLSFELPVVVMTIVKIGLLDYNIMKNTRAYAVLAIVILAAVITPTPDAFTLMLLAGPMIVLYEICIWLAYLDGKKQRKADQAAAEEKPRLEKVPITPVNAISHHDDEDDGPDSELETEANSEDLDLPDDHPANQGEDEVMDHDKVYKELKELKSLYGHLDEHKEEDEYDELGYKIFVCELESTAREYKRLKKIEAEVLSSDEDSDDEGNEEDDGVYDFGDDDAETAEIDTEDENTPEQPGSDSK